jgi:hypothetical protein
VLIGGDKMSDDCSNLGLVLAFTNDTSDFTEGFEVGRIWQEMLSGVVEIMQTVHLANREVLHRAAVVLGYEYAEEILDDNWFILTLTKHNTVVGNNDKTEPSKAKNPFGFSIVR